MPTCELIRSSSTDADLRTGYKKSARAQKVRDGLLPPPVLLGGRASAFIAAEIDAVIAARANGASDDEVRALVRRLVAERAKWVVIAQSGKRDQRRCP